MEWAGPRYPVLRVGQELEEEGLQAKEWLRMNRARNMTLPWRRLWQWQGQSWTLKKKYLRFPTHLPNKRAQRRDLLRLCRLGYRTIFPRSPRSLQRPPTNLRLDIKINTDNYQFQIRSYLPYRPAYLQAQPEKSFSVLF